METKFHFRVRAVVAREGKVLAVRGGNGKYFFLPGGHVETGESIPAALLREMLEESGRTCGLKEYLGAIEASWVEGNVRQWEITHFFEVTIPDPESNPVIISPEENLEFAWISPSEFESGDLLPLPLRDLLNAWLAGDKKPWWGSSME